MKDTVTLKVKYDYRFKFLYINFFFIIVHLLLSFALLIYFEMTFNYKNILFIIIPFILLSGLIYIPTFYIDYSYSKMNNGTYVFEKEQLVITKNNSKVSYMYKDISKIVLHATPKKIINSSIYNASHEDYFYFELFTVSNKVTLTCLLGTDLQNEIDYILENNDQNLIVKKRTYPFLN